MSDFMDDIQFTIWSKGPIALNTTRSAIGNYLKSKWKDEIKSWSPERQAHIPIFLKEIKDEKIKLVDVTEKRKRLRQPVYLCNHVLCKEILGRLQELHQNPKHIILKREHPTKANPQGADSFWEFASMYSGEYSDSKPSTCPDDTEAAIVFRIMKNCKLFDLDDNSIYENIIGVGRALMHSPTYQLTYDELDSYLKIMKDFLEAVHESENHACDEKNTCSFKQNIEKAKEELNKLLARKSPFERTKEDLEMMKNAFKEQRKALEADQRSSGIPSSTLNLILKENKKKTEQVTVFITRYEQICIYPDPDKRKQEYERLLEKDQKEEKARILAEEKRKLYEIEERRRLEESGKRMDRAVTVGTASAGMATGMAIGAVAGPVGSVIGGAIGGLATIFRK